MLITLLPGALTLGSRPTSMNWVRYSCSDMPLLAEAHAARMSARSASLRFCTTRCPTRSLRMISICVLIRAGMAPPYSMVLTGSGLASISTEAVAVYTRVANTRYSTEASTTAPNTSAALIQRARSTARKWVRLMMALRRSEQAFLDVDHVAVAQLVVHRGFELRLLAVRAGARHLQAAQRAARRGAAAGRDGLHHRHAAFQAQRARMLDLAVQVDLGRAVHEDGVARRDHDVLG